jgi:hypothetical protein
VGFGVCGDGLVQPPLALQSNAEVEVNLGRLRIMGEVKLLRLSWEKVIVYF